MSTPIDRSDPQSLSYYAPRRSRISRLGEVSRAAAGVPPEDQRESFDTALDAAFDNALEAAGDLKRGDVAMQRLRAPSIDPEVVIAPMMPARKSWLQRAIGPAALVSISALIALVVIGQLPLPTWQRQTSDRAPQNDRAPQLASASSRSVAPAPAKPAEAMIPRLMGETAFGMMGEPTPLGVTLQGRADGAIVMITGLPSGITISAGGALGANAWQIPATDLGNAWVVPPKDFVGGVDVVAELRFADGTIAHRRPLHLAWAAPPRATPVAAAPAVAPAPPPVVAAAPAPRKLDRSEISVLLNRGRQFISNGDLAAARVVLQRAAEADDAESALALAATYDPVALRELRVYGIAADVEKARTWYERARALGSPEAPNRLEMLASSKVR